MEGSPARNPVRVDGHAAHASRRARLLVLAPVIWFGLERGSARGGPGSIHCGGRGGKHQGARGPEGGNHQARVVMVTVATLALPDFVGSPSKLNKEDHWYYFYVIHNFNGLYGVLLIYIRDAIINICD